MAVRVGRGGNPGGRPFVARAAGERLWAHGDPGAGSSDLGMMRIRREPFQTRPFFGAVGTGLGRAFSTPRRISDNGLRRVDNGSFGVAGLEDGALNHDNWDEIATLDRGGFGAPVPVQDSNAPTEAYLKAVLTDGPQAKVGPFRVALRKLIDGANFFTMTPLQVMQATGADGRALPGDFGAAKRIWDAVADRIVNLSESRCAVIQNAFFTGCLPAGQSYKGVTIPGGRISPAVLDGKVPLFRFKHPETGKDMGVYLTVETTTGSQGSTMVKYYRFHCRVIEKGFWASLWDWIKELVVDIIRFVGDVLRDLAKQLCSAAQQFLGGLAEVPDRARAGGQWTPQEIAVFDRAGVTMDQRRALAAGALSGVATVAIGQAVAKNLCAILDGSGNPPPLPQPASSGGGIVIAAAAGAALLFFFLR